MRKRKSNDIECGETVVTAPHSICRFHKGSFNMRGKELRIFFKTCDVHTNDQGQIIEWDKVLECSIPYYGDIPTPKK